MTMVPSTMVFTSCPGAATGTSTSPVLGTDVPSLETFDLNRSRLGGAVKTSRPPGRSETLTLTYT